METVQGVQLVPQKSPRKVFVWLESVVDLNRYCYSDSLRGEDGVKTGLIQPMDRREEEVFVRVPNIITPDDYVLNYLSHFGKALKQEARHMKNKEEHHELRLKILH